MCKFTVDLCNSKPCKLYITVSSQWMPKQKRARGRLKKNWMERIKKAMNERNLNEGQWEDRKQWSLGVGQHRKRF